ncbi:MAG: hypothetical protein JWN34_477, partial [Bryobacterales bacterium]|nr:hypothetical protein [Bryobacterales bacterium]
MLVVIIVDLIVVIAMLRAASRGFEHALPVATFALILIPIECFIPLGLFTITPQRLIIGLLVLLYLNRKKPQSGAAG